MCANMNKLALCVSTQAGPFIDIPAYFGGKMLCFGVRTRFEKKCFFDRQEFRKKKHIHHSKVEHLPKLFTFW